MKTAKKENGQILVILAVALVAILGITALAVDSSMVYNERRQDQTTADSVALSAANKAAGSTNCDAAKPLAVDNAKSLFLSLEGVTLAEDSTSPNRVEATCSTDKKKLEIKIVVTTEAETTFAQMVSASPITTTVESTSQVTFGGGKFAGGNGIVALGTTCGDPNGGIHLKAHANTLIKGGGVYSRSCIYVNNAYAALMTDGADILYAGKGAYKFFAGDLEETTGSNGIIFHQNSQAFMVSDPNFSLPTVGHQLWGTKDPYTANMAIGQDLWPIPTDPIDAYSNLSIPDMVAQICNGTDYGSYTIPWSETTLEVGPGTYTNLTQGWTDARFKSGVYCIRDGGYVKLGGKNSYADNTYWYFMGSGSFEKTGAAYPLNLSNSSVYIKEGNFSVTGSPNLIANNTTIFIEQGSFYATGNVPTVLTAPDCISTDCTVSHAIPGVALYLKDKKNYNNTVVEITGSSSLNLGGTIFAPKSKVTVSGTSTLLTLHSQVICKRFYTEGSSPITFDLVNANIYSGGGGTTSVELLK